MFGSRLQERQYGRSSRSDVVRSDIDSSAYILGEKRERYIGIYDRWTSKYPNVSQLPIISQLRCAGLTLHHTLRSQVPGDAATIAAVCPDSP
ncbi:uncharacterized protein LOC125500004 isoform X3 [Athalia rosae]|nr:uncharacterized protein LOC125500004 isoform X3 [Athalia rosae]